MARRVATLALCTLLIGCSVLAQSQEPPKTPRVESKQETKDSPPTESNSAERSQGAVTEPISTEAGHHESSKDAGNSGEQGTEFWPAFYGYRLKITDTLLVLFTGLLFAATKGGPHVAMLGTPGSPAQVDVGYEIADQHNDAT